MNTEKKLDYFVEDEDILVESIQADDAKERQRDRAAAYKKALSEASENKERNDADN